MTCPATVPEGLTAIVFSRIYKVETPSERAKGSSDSHSLGVPRRLLLPRSLDASPSPQQLDCHAATSGVLGQASGVLRTKKKGVPWATPLWIVRRGSFMLGVGVRLYPHRAPGPIAKLRACKKEAKHRSARTHDERWALSS